MRFGNYALRHLNNNYYSGEKATTGGIYRKSFILLVITLVCAICSMILTSLIPLVTATVFYFVIPIVTLVLGLIIAFNPLKAKALAIPYVVCEGFSIGILCFLIAYVYEGGFAISCYALLITIGIYLGASFLYHRLEFRLPSRFLRLFFSILLGICIASIFFSLISMFISLFDGGNMIHSLYSSNLGIGISILMVVLASIYVFINIQTIDNSVNMGMDREYEWYAAYGLALSVIWLFLEVLELLLRLISRSRK